MKKFLLLFIALVAMSASAQDAVMMTDLRVINSNPVFDVFHWWYVLYAIAGAWLASIFFSEIAGPVAGLAAAFVGASMTIYFFCNSGCRYEVDIGLATASFTYSEHNGQRCVQAGEMVKLPIHVFKNIKE